MTASQPPSIMLDMRCAVRNITMDPTPGKVIVVAQVTCYRPLTRSLTLLLMTCSGLFGPHNISTVRRTVIQSAAKA